MSSQKHKVGQAQPMGSGLAPKPAPNAPLGHAQTLAALMASAALAAKKASR